MVAMLNCSNASWQMPQVPLGAVLWSQVIEAGGCARIAVEYDSSFLPQPVIAASLQSHHWRSRLPFEAASTAPELPELDLSPQTIAEGSQHNSSHDDHAEDQGAEQDFSLVISYAVDMSQAIVTPARCCLLTASCPAGH